MGQVGTKILIYSGFFKSTCVWAARNGNLEMLKWARSQDPLCPWDEIMWWAASNGNLEMLKWLRSQDPPCPWNNRCRSTTHTHILNYLDENNCPQ